MGNKISIADTSYIKSRVWICLEAPLDSENEVQWEYGAGAHYWIEEWNPDRNRYEFKCRYCGKTQKSRKLAMENSEFGYDQFRI